MSHGRAMLGPMEAQRSRSTTSRPSSGPDQVPPAGLTLLVGSEQYLIGRYHMFQNVYLHKTSRGFEGAFGSLCRRLRALGTAALPARGWMPPVQELSHLKMLPGPGPIRSTGK